MNSNLIAERRIKNLLFRIYDLIFYKNNITLCHDNGQMQYSVEHNCMKNSYDKLWKLLIDKKMSRVALREKAHISTTSLAKLGKEQNVSMEVLRKICIALDCNIGDIVELVPLQKDSTSDENK